MPLRRPSALTLLTCTLLILLPALAVLQYRWVGQVSEAERDRMQRNLRTAAIQFRDAFDGEVGRAVFGLRAGAATLRNADWERYADRYATWAATAEYPGLIAAVYVIDAEDGAVRLRRWNAAAHTFEAAPWSGPLSAWQPTFERALAEFASGEPLELQLPHEDESLLVAPLLDVLRGPPPPRRDRPDDFFGLTVLQLDMGYIRGHVLPALVQQHFTDAEGDRYRVAVATRGSEPRIIYQSDPSAPVDPERADAREPMHGAFADRRRDRGRADGRTNVIVGVFRDGGDGAQATVRRFVNRDAGRWTLLVQHESGSLEAAVAAVRRRNLGISFGILLLLTVSVGLLTVSSRREQRLARQQIEFVAGVSHELRTPVAVIRSAAENLAQGVVGSGDRVKRYGEMIESEARRLGDMVERVLQYAGIESGRAVVARAPLAPADIVNAAIDAAAPVVGPMQVQRRIAEDLPPVLGDAAALQSAVQNLIVNAAKYGRPPGAGGGAWIGVTVERDANNSRDQVRITVEDRGPGIPPAELPHIFDPFYRGAEAVSRQIQGNGLGLSLVKRIATAHGGDVSVASRPGGTAFSIRLPAAAAAQS